jgi:hypothetical protein
VKFGVLAAVAVKVTDFWDATPLTYGTNHKPFARTLPPTTGNVKTVGSSIPDDMTLKPVRYYSSDRKKVSNSMCNNGIDVNRITTEAYDLHINVPTRTVRQDK